MEMLSTPPPRETMEPTQNMPTCLLCRTIKVRLLEWFFSTELSQQGRGFCMFTLLRKGKKRSDFWFWFHSLFLRTKRRGQQDRECLNLRPSGTKVHIFVSKPTLELFTRIIFHQSDGQTLTSACHPHPVFGNEPRKKRHDCDSSQLQKWPRVLQAKRYTNEFSLDDQTEIWCSEIHCIKYWKVFSVLTSKERLNKTQPYCHTLSITIAKVMQQSNITDSNDLWT